MTSKPEKNVSCPRLLDEIAGFRQMYSYASRRFIKSMIKYHSCQDCRPGTKNVFLPRDPDQGVQP